MLGRPLILFSSVGLHRILIIRWRVEEIDLIQNCAPVRIHFNLRMQGHVYRNRL